MVNTARTVRWDDVFSDVDSGRRGADSGDPVGRRDCEKVKEVGQ